MKIILKNSDLVFEKTYFEKNVTIEGKMTPTEKGGNNVLITGLNPDRWYKFTWPVSQWAITNWSQYNILENNGRYNNVASTTTRLTVSQPHFVYLYENVRICYLKGIDAISLFARADLGTDVEIIVEEIEIVKIKVHTYTLNVTQGTGVYSLESQFTPSKNKFYSARINDLTKVTGIEMSFVNSTDSTKSKWISMHDDLGVMLNSDSAPFSKVQISPIYVVGTGAVTIDLFELTEKE